MLKKYTVFFACVALGLSASGTFALTPPAPVGTVDRDIFQVLVRGNTISWADDTYGYMQVQDAQTYESFCEFQVLTLEDTPGNNRDGTLCTLEPGIYNVTNHSFGQRIERVSVGDKDGIYTAPRRETIGNNIVEYDPFLAIDAESIYSEFDALPEPANLFVDVYSPSAAEIFWDRSDVPGLQYDVLVNTVLVGTTDGTSFFLNTLQPLGSVEVSVIATNAQGGVSSAASVTVETPDDGSAVPFPGELVQPTGLRSALYSPDTLELFWDRQGPGQLFQVYDGEANLLATTDGTSFFATGLPPADNYIFNVVSIDSEENRSGAAVIVVATSEPEIVFAPAEPTEPMEPMEPTITMDNAEALLGRIVSIANREQFAFLESMLEAGADAVVEASLDVIQSGASSSADLTLVDGTGGVPDTIGGNGIDGGSFICNAGGTAAAQSVLGGDSGNESTVGFSECRLPGGEYSGTVYSGDLDTDDFVLRSSYRDAVVSPDTGTLAYGFTDTSKSYGAPFSNDGQIDDEMRVDVYSEDDPDSFELNELLIVSYASIHTSRVGLSYPDNLSFEGPDFSAGQVLSRSAEADITFGVRMADFSPDGDTQLLYVVFIKLQYDGNVEANDPVDLWNSGSITIVSTSDDSELVATPADADADTTFESMLITVGDQEIVRPLSDGYLVSCRRAELEECNI